MRVAVLFFLALCAYFLGGSGSARALTPYGHTSQLWVEATAKNLQAESATPPQASLLSKKEGSGKNSGYLVYVEDEGEDDEDYVIKKYVVPARFFSALPVTSFAAAGLRHLTLSFCQQASPTGSPIYLQQRVLRI